VRRNKRLGFILVLPSTLIILLILVLPLFYSLFTSFHKFDNLFLGNFVGFGNYKAILTDSRIINSIVLGVGITLLTTACSVFFGILLSLWIDSQSNKYAYLLQLLCLIPWFTSMIVAALSWKWILNTQFGLFNYVLKLIGFHPLQIMEKPKLAFLALAFVMAWRTVGYVMILVLSGLKVISTDMLEAAKTDGASYLQTLFKIKLPNINSQIVLAFIIITLATFNNATVPLAFNTGGPANATNVMALELYLLGFQQYSFGKDSALSMVVLLINIAIIIFYMRSMRYGRDE
jgi:ABC-type sugar transport system permease subunit